MYKSPIDILVTDIQHQIAEQQDEQIYQAVVSVGISVDEAELIRALAYDRHQYMKGYADAMDSIVRCGECEWCSQVQGPHCVHPTGGMHEVELSDFCSHGERRTTDEI